MATLQQLRYLIAVAEYGSINAAARELFATQSNLSTAIKDLEQELGVTLDRESYNYARFAMHIQFLVRRLSTGTAMEQGSGGMLTELASEYPKIYLCACKVAKAIEDKHGWHCSRDEVLYLMLHIYRVQSRDDG